MAVPSGETPTWSWQTTQAAGTTAVIELGGLAPPVIHGPPRLPQSSFAGRYSA